MDGAALNEALRSEPARPPAASDAEDTDEDEQQEPQGDQEWDEWEASDGGDEEPTPSLFEPSRKLASPAGAIEYDSQHHGFHLLSFAKQVRRPGPFIALAALHAARSG